MLCDRCQTEVPADETHQHGSQTLCDDCYMDAMAPTSGCNPWAEYLASRLKGQGETFSPLQEKILAMVNESGRASADDLLEATGLEVEALKKEVVPLRHKQMVQWERRPDGSYALRLLEQSA